MHGISPRVKLAARLYVTGAVATKREAAEAAGLHPTYFSVVTAPQHSRYKPEVGQLMDEIDKAIHDKSIQTSALLELIGREALTEMRGLMKKDDNLAIKFKAAQDLLDRSPETSKIQKHAISSFSLDGADAKQLAAAMVQAAQIRAAYEGEVTGDYVRIPVDPIQEGPDDARQLPHAPEVRSLDQVGTVGPSGRGQSVREGIAELQQGTAARGPASQAPAA